MNYDYDALILGSGSAAFAAALKITELGGRVAVTEHREIGGTCVNRGCIPSKNLIRAAEIYHLAGNHPFPGIKTRREEVDFAALASQKDELVHYLRRKKYLDLAAGNEKITILSGRAGFMNEATVLVNGKPITAGKFLIATGARPFIPPVKGLGDVPYLTSDLLSSEEQYALKEMPESLVVIGGGVIACELGQMFNRLGVQVTILQKGDRLLTGIDRDVAETLCDILNEEGVRTICNANVESVTGDGERIEVTAEVGGEKRKFAAARLLVAAGVRPNTEGLNLDAAGVGTDAKGFVEVDETMRTSNKNIWAAGDVAGPPLATPVSAREGVVAAVNVMGECRDRKMDRRVIPRVVFTDPEVATVGMTLDKARKEGFDAEERSLKLDAVPRAACMRDTRGLVKMVVEKESKRILGVHLVAHSGGEIIHEAAVAIRANWTITDLIDTIHVYPTMAEAIRMVAQTFEKDVSKLSCCAE